MYNDYTIAYESNINEYIIPIVIGIFILLIIAIICLISLIRIFKKANRSGIAAIIPIYNFIVMMEIINKPTWQIILLFIPFINLIIYAQVLFKIAKSFRKTNTFAFLTVLFPFVFLPILGFSDSEYIGINQEAMIGISYASDKPILKEEELEATKPDEVKETKPLDISIGGGVYQKEYQESLLDVPSENKNIDLLATFKVEPETIVQKEEKTGIDLLKNVTFIENEETKQSDLQMPIQIDNPKVISPNEIYNDTIPTIVEKSPIDNNITAIDYIPTIIESVDDRQDRGLPTSNINELSEHTENANLNMNPIYNDDSHQYIKCSHCGAILKSNATKCFMCGKEL